MEDTPQNQSGNNIQNNTEGGIGPVIGSLIIVIMLIIAALYIWGEHLNTEAQIQQANQSAGASTTIVTYSTSTAPSDIEKDLKANASIQSRGF
jgi:hypothetical protein